MHICQLAMYPALPERLSRWDGPTLPFSLNIGSVRPESMTAYQIQYDSRNLLDMFSDIWSKIDLAATQQTESREQIEIP